MATPPPPPSSSSSSSSTPSSFSASSSGSDAFTPSEWTQNSMLSDLMQQKGLLIGLGVAVVVLWLFLRGRPQPQEKAARRLVRDMKKVDDPDDARDLLGDNLPTIIRPALLIALHEIENQVHKGFDKLERELDQL